jgi:hypothetical protein
VVAALKSDKFQALAQRTSLIAILPRSSGGAREREMTAISVMVSSERTAPRIRIYRREPLSAWLCHGQRKNCSAASALGHLSLGALLSLIRGKRREKGASPALLMAAAI